MPKNTLFHSGYPLESIGKATELLRYDGANGYTTGTIGKIMSGGGTQITLDTSALKLLPGK